MKILFSPIGNSDPWRNDRDGAMLNILRTYRPDLVFLFFTKSIWEGGKSGTAQKDFDWKKIIQNISKETVVEHVVESVALENDFDSYKELFHSYLVQLEERFPEAELLLNVTSGTPQMETTLCLEYITYPNNKKCIQVATPLKSSNARTKFANPEDQEIDLEIVNKEESVEESRCKEIAIISFREAMVRNQVKTLIDNFDYEAALSLIAAQKSFRNGKKMRKVLSRVTDDIKTHNIFSEIVGRYKDENLQKALFHYLLLDMRQRRGDTAETLIRVKSVAEFIAEHYLKKRYPNLVITHDGKPYLNMEYEKEFIDQYKLEMSARGVNFDGTRILGFPAYRDFLLLLEPKCELLKQMNVVNEINQLRNKVAHNLDNLYLNKHQNGKKIAKSVHAVREMLGIVYPDIHDEDYDYFEQLNQRIRELL